MRASREAGDPFAVGRPDCIDSGHGIRPGHHRGHRERHVGRGAARRDRRGGEPGADREGSLGRDRRTPASTRSSISSPGTYTVTFTLPGFNTVTREGVELAGSFAAKIDAELRVGALEETITVTGETPIVDVQNTRRQRVIDREVIDNIPTSRTALRLGGADSRRLPRRSHEPGRRRVVLVWDTDRQRRGPRRPHGRPGRCCATASRPSGSRGPVFRRRSTSTRSARRR